MIKAAMAAGNLKFKLQHSLHTYNTLSTKDLKRAYNGVGQLMQATERIRNKISLQMQMRERVCVAK